MKKSILLILSLITLLFINQCTVEKQPQPSEEEPTTETEEEKTLIEFGNVDIICKQDDQFSVYYHIIENPHMPSEVGIVYNLEGTPTVSDNKVKSFSTSITHNTHIPNLQRSTKYYVRVYAINDVGTSYSNEYKVTTKEESFPFEIGDEYEGGIILSFGCSGEHGVIVAERDIPGNHSWSVAVDEANAAVINGYSDWRLPSPGELTSCYHNLHSKGQGNFQTGSLYDRYWSNLKMNTNRGGVNYYEARAYDFEEGKSFVMNQPYKLNVRLVRDF